MRVSKEIKVALLGLAALIILYFGFLYLKGAPFFSGSRTFYVVYPDVGGLTVSNPVMLNGVQVGTVQELELLTEEGNQIRVQLEITKKLHIGDSTIASLASSDILGSKAIELTLGNSTKMYNGGERLIPFKETSITDMLSQKSMPVIDKVDTTLARLNTLLDSTSRDNIQGTLANTRQTTEALNEMLRANQRNISLITANMAQMTAALRETERKLNYLVSNMNDITDTLKRVEINKLVDNANEMVTEMETTVAKLNSDQGSLGKLMNDEELYANLNRSSEALNLLLRDIQAYPKRYVQFSLFGRKDKYKVTPTGRVITLEEVKEMQENHPDEFKRSAPTDTVRPVPADTLTRN
ncbi:MlaD family protein [Botryobacter ruber]|uniref:MlaD family protein n=1 Tax=Botryobacter ruber TaxID=2171629 RepID=UPI000E0B61A4|nr:MlaD family protein [Botryobacter ruber]